MMIIFYLVILVAFTLLLKERIGYSGYKIDKLIFAIVIYACLFGLCWEIGGLIWPGK